MDALPVRKEDPVTNGVPEKSCLENGNVKAPREKKKCVDRGGLIGIGGEKRKKWASLQEKTIESNVGYELSYVRTRFGGGVTSSSRESRYQGREREGLRGRNVKEGSI